jgi:hypothetical protein
VFSRAGEYSIHGVFFWKILTIFRHNVHPHVIGVPGACFAWHPSRASAEAAYAQAQASSGGVTEVLVWRCFELRAPSLLYHYGRLAYIVLSTLLHCYFLLCCYSCCVVTSCINHTFLIPSLSWTVT